MKQYLFITAILVIYISEVFAAPSKATIEKLGQYRSSPEVIAGGEITDMRDFRSIRWGKHQHFERIVLDIYEGAYDKKGSPVPIPCSFIVKYEYYPFRFTVKLTGIRARNAKYGVFPKSKLIQETYMLPLLDDAAIKFAIALKKPVDYEVFELHNPGRIVIDIRENKNLETLPDLYFIRTNTGLGFEELGHLEELLNDLGAKNIRILKSSNNQLLLEEGHYFSKKDAENRLNYLITKVNEYNFFIEKRNASSIPQ